MSNRGSRTVLFVCRHGAAKSVLAAADLRRMASERRLQIVADAAGIEPSESVSPAVFQALGRDGHDLAPPKPRRVTQAELRSAWRVITFNLDPADLPALTPDAEPWDDVPAVSENPSGARAVIGHHLEHLLEDLGGG